MNTPRKIGQKLEDLVNDSLGLQSTINSGASDRHGHCSGYDHSNERIVGESKVKNSSKRPVITQKDFDKLLKKAEKAGYKDWLYFVQYNDGKNTAVMLDFNFFAELWNNQKE